MPCTRDGAPQETSDFLQPFDPCSFRHINECASCFAFSELSAAPAAPAGRLNEKERHGFIVHGETRLGTLENLFWGTNGVSRATSTLQL